jgi:predicted Rossmann-fold nucleotide-binding protein
VTLIQTAEIGEFPLVLMGNEFWCPSRDFMSNRLVAGKTIDQTDLDRLIVSDSPPEAIEAITDAAKRRWVFDASEPG